MSDEEQKPNWREHGDEVFNPPAPSVADRHLDASEGRSAPPSPPPGSETLANDKAHHTYSRPHEDPWVTPTDGDSHLTSMRPPLTGGPSPGTAWVMAGTALLAIVAAIVALAANVIADGHYSEYSDLLDRSRRALAQRAFLRYERASNVAATAAAVALGALLFVFALLVSWSFNLYRFTQKISVQGRMWSQWWALGSWLIPVASIVLPFLVLNEANRVLIATRRGEPHKWRQAPYSRPLLVWEVALISSFLLTIIGFIMNTSGVGDGDPWGLAGSILGLASVIPLVGFIYKTETGLRHLRSTT